MSHIAVRIVADHLDSAELGANACAASVPRDGDDPLPSAVHVYDETRHGWLARDDLPRPEHAAGKVEYPALLVSLVSLSMDGGAPRPAANGALVETGVVTIAVQVAIRATRTEDAVSEAMYLLRASRASLRLLDASASAVRTRCSTLLSPSSSVSQGKSDRIAEDLIVSDVLLVTYPFTEAAPALPPAA